VRYGHDGRPRKLTLKAGISLAVGHFRTGKDERPIEAFTLTIVEGAK
jgi:hypothetical protein